MECLVCSHCFQFIGSIELQIGRKLFLQNLGDFKKNGEIASPRGLKDCEDHEDDTDSELDEQDMEQCGPSSSKSVSLPNDVVESLMNGGIQLPYSDQFQLPPVVSCPGGCKEAFYCRCLFSSYILLFLEMSLWTLMRMLRWLVSKVYFDWRNSLHHMDFNLYLSIPGQLFHLLGEWWWLEIHLNSSWILHPGKSSRFWYNKP